MPYAARGEGILPLRLGTLSHRNRVKRAARCIASHSVPVQTGGGLTEEVCVSNADAMAQIVKPAYWFYYVFRVRQLGFGGGRDWLRQRVESNWAALIPPARALIKKEYICLARRPVSWGARARVCE